MSTGAANTENDDKVHVECILLLLLIVTLRYPCMHSRKCESASMIRLDRISTQMNRREHSSGNNAEETNPPSAERWKPRHARIPGRGGGGRQPTCSSTCDHAFFVQKPLGVKPQTTYEYELSWEVFLLLFFSSRLFASPFFSFSFLLSYS